MFEIKTELTVPSNDEYYQIVLASRENPNQFHYWFKPLKSFTDSIFSIPNSTSNYLPRDMFFMLHQEHDATPEEQARFNRYCDEVRKSAGISYPCFIKNGLFSGKFEFNHCVCKNADDFYRNFKEIHYMSLMFGVDLSDEFVIRALIPTSTETHIYTNMPLNVELRAFIDFDKKSLLGIIDYWHEKICSQLPAEQHDIFLKYKKENEICFKEQCLILQNELSELLKKDKMPLTGQWSLDFLFDGKKLWFIDAALASQSWGFDMITS